MSGVHELQVVRIIRIMQGLRNTGAYGLRLKA